MTDTITAGLIAGAAFVAIGCLSWYFSTRRKLLLRIFATDENIRAVARSLPRDGSFGRGMRIIALLQMALGIVIVLITLGAWLIG